MGVTYTTAAERTVRQARRLTFGVMDLGLAGASVLALALVLVVSQTGSRSGRVGAAPEVPTINLNTIPDAKPLDPVLLPIMEDAADRQLASRLIFAFLARADGGRR